MKKLILAADRRRNPLDYFGDIYNQAVNAGYSMNVSDDMTVTFRAKVDSQYMPKITVETLQDTDGYYFMPKLEFPTLDQKNMENSDDMQYYIKKWVPVGRIVKDLAELSINPADYEE